MMLELQFEQKKEHSQFFGHFASKQETDFSLGV